MEKKNMSDSVTILSQWALPADTNPYGTVHGGVIMKLVDNAAAVAAIRHFGQKSVTSHVHELSLVSHVTVGDVIEAKAFVSYTYNSRMIVEVEVTKENPYSRESEIVSKAILIFVGQDPEPVGGKVRYAPKVIAITEEEKIKYANGKEWYSKKFEKRFAKVTKK